MPPLSDQEDIKVQCHLQFSGITLGAAGLGKRSGNPPAPTRKGGMEKSQALIAYAGKALPGVGLWSASVGPVP